MYSTSQMGKQGSEGSRAACGDLTWDLVTLSAQGRVIPLSGGHLRLTLIPVMSAGWVLIFCTEGLQFSLQEAAT